MRVRRQLQMFRFGAYPKPVSLTTYFYHAMSVLKNASLVGFGGLRSVFVSTFKTPFCPDCAGTSSIIRAFEQETEQSISQPPSIFSPDMEDGHQGLRHVKLLFFTSTCTDEINWKPRFPSSFSRYSDGVLRESR